MRILVAGDWHSELHEETVFHAFRKLGHTVARFSWHEYFRGGSGPVGLWRRAQNKFVAGPLIGRINHDLVAAAERFDPDFVVVYRGTHIEAATLHEIQRRCPRARLIGYNNDDPYAPGHPRWLWRHFLACIPHYDLVLAYRHSNVEDFRRAGARRVELLRSWYCEDRNHPVALSPEERARFDCDVTFIGHYEDDSRVACLEEVVRNGWRLRLYGPGYDWDPAIAGSALLRSQIPVRLVWGEDYNRALCGAKIALCFFSRLNRDTYTRRCFEIPATATMMLSEHSDDLASMFREGEEAEFFRSPGEMVEKLRRYLSDNVRRTAVAQAGRRRVIADGHDVVSRMRQVLQWVDAIAAREGA